MAKRALAEALSNLVFAQISSISDIKCSINWMYAAKMDQEGIQMYEAAKALR